LRFTRATAGQHVFPANKVSQPYDALRHQLRVLDQLSCVGDDNTATRLMGPAGNYLSVSRFRNCENVKLFTFFRGLLSFIKQLEPSMRVGYKHFH
jgi:hypothetical protein